ncbi:hypothetical protein ACF0H5_022590 [Mactra antiquata]
MTTKMLFIVLAALFYSADSGTTCCKDGWLPYSGSCYMFYDEHKVDWNEAVTYCRNRNSQLVSIETAHESTFLKSFARKLFKAAPPGKNSSSERNVTAFWLGASDTDIEGLWKWVSTDEEVSYTEWDLLSSKPQPNNDPDNKEDCLALNGAYDFNWHDGLCEERLGYPLCEIRTDDGNSMQVIG